MKQLTSINKNYRLLCLKQISTLVLILILANNRINGQDDLNVITNKWLQYTDAPNSLYHHLSGQAYKLIDQRSKTIAKINTLTGWQERQKEVKETLRDIVGPFPEKTPLNARTIRKIRKDGYKVEHVVFESQPKFYVTSSLFIPEGIGSRKKAPVIIYCSGHSDLGYRGDVYQHVILNLVKKGFIVFAYDPIGQGERFDYLDLETGKPVPGISQHSYPGIQAFISGSNLARYMIWDGIRAVDYLLTRKEVDPARIGITGRSGGGTQSSYIAAMDDRIYAVAPENYLTNFSRLLQSIGPQDAEQNMFNSIKRGIDHADLLIVRAPLPALMITTTRDIFNIQGVYETKNEVARIYETYNKEENFSITEDDAPHASTKKNREAMYAFFQTHLNNPGNPEDEETQPLSPAEIQVTITGQVTTSLGGETVFTLNSKEAEKLVNKLRTSRPDIQNHLSQVVNSAKDLSGYREPTYVNEPVFTSRFQREGYVVEKYILKGEGEYVIPYLLMKPDNSNNKALIYLHPDGKATEASAGGEMEWFIMQGFTVIAPDLLGIGETGKRDTVFNHPYMSKWFASVLTGRSIVAIRAGDVVRLTHLLKNK